MRFPRLQARHWEAGFLTLLAVLCLLLLGMQYRWTGEISRAESNRLRATLGESLQRLGQSFDSELRATCEQLLPSAEDIHRYGWEAAHQRLFQTWKSGHNRSCFARISFAVPNKDGVALREMDVNTGQIRDIEWPANWAPMKHRLESLRFGQSQPQDSMTDPASMLIEFPVFEEASADDGPPPHELEWLLLELDPDYLREIWMPELVRAYLNPGPESLFDLDVRAAAGSNSLVYSSNPSRAKRDRIPDGVSRCFNAEFMQPLGALGPNYGFQGRGRWLLEGRCQEGQLETVVAHARWRNLAVGGLVNGLILAAGAMLVRQTRHSRRTVEAQMNFVAAVSHELRTPLAVIRSAAHNLLKGVVQDPARKAEYVQLIAEQAEQLKKMIEQVLVFSSLRAAAAATRHTNVSLPEILRRAAESLDAELKNSGCRIEWCLTEDIPEVVGDAASLERLFQNLLGNAAKHGAAGGWIRISAGRTRVNGAELVEARIADRGGGIPLGEQAAVFKPFFRGGRARKEQIHGTGLGLSVAWEIVQAHRGTISLMSAVGKGTEVCVRLRTASSPENL